jgi:hypothetical protein
VLYLGQISKGCNGNRNQWPRFEFRKEHVKIVGDSPFVNLY